MSTPSASNPPPPGPLIPSDDVLSNLKVNGDIVIEADLIVDGDTVLADVTCESLTATTGDITATAGDVVVTAGDVVVTAGDVAVALGSVTAIDLVNSSKAAFTQLTSPTTPVAAGTSSSGVITTFAGTLAAQGTETFVVTTTKALTGSVVLLSYSYTGTGSPIVKFGAIVNATSFEISVTNYHASAALNASLVISFLIV